MRTLYYIIRTMRPGQWVKNLFVTAPVLFAKAHTAADPSLLLDAVLATGVFVLLSGAVYVMNDVLDVDKDRNHPVRRERPVASGRLSIQAAVAGGLAALASAFGASALLGPAFALTSAAYLGLNILYSGVLKRLAWLDVLSIAAGFVLRILAGCFAIRLAPAEISYYLIVCTFLIALFLAIGKRRHELAVLGDDSGNHRSVLSRYRLRHLDVALYAVGALTMVAYVLYTISARTQAYFGTWRLVLTAPLVLTGILRFLAILRRAGERRSPTDMMIRDGVFVANGALWVAVVVWAVYW